MRPAARRAIFETLREANPAPTTELVYGSPFQLLVAVILSAQMTDRGVNAATAELFRVAPDAPRMLALGVQGLKRYLRTINFYNTKAANIIKTCRALVEEHGGKVPNDRIALEALPGVGRKTASVILNTAFGATELAVDTHIFRVARRTGLADGATVRAVEDQLVASTPSEFLRNAHHWLLLHGRYVCKARCPECWRCVIRRWCEYPHKTPAP